MHVLLRKLTALYHVPEEERQSLVDALDQPRAISRGLDILADGTSPQSVTVMLSGAACRYKVMSKGKRHILAFHYPGDMTDLSGYVVKRLDYAVGALSDCLVAQISHEVISALCTRYPNLLHTFWRDTIIDAAISHSWALGCSRPTLARVAHLLCESFVRLQAVGLANHNHPLPFILTQKDIADALGLSLVHTNRTIAALKLRNLIGPSGAKLQILNWDGLAEVAEFDPAYLQLKHHPADTSFSYN